MAAERRETGAGRRVQYSIRSAFVAVALLAASLAIGRWCGAVWGLGALFLIASASATVALGGAWRRAFGIAWAALYAPFAATAVYTLVNVPCMHCKTTYCSLAPGGPGFLLVAWGVFGLGLPRPSDLVWLAIAVAVSTAMLIALSWLVRSTRWVGYAAAGVALAYTSFSAWALLAVVRS